MGVASNALYYMVHPNQLRDIIQWAIWHEPVHKRNLKTETPTVKSCFRLLDLTSRSFSAVIQELNPELLLPVTLFYLVLRGLDTIEDDMTIDIKKKEPLLRNFHTHLREEGWNFTESGPNEKDRDCLVHFDDVIYELIRTEDKYYNIIHDTCVKMGNGMADYAVNAEFNEKGVEKVVDYEQYCHYVAGLVGEGLTRLFLEAKLANPALGTRPELTESMGQFLQKTNIIRDVHEDMLDKRRFWPHEIWSKYVDNWDDLFKPEYLEQALHCQSEMILNALKHADECLFYMAGIRDQSVFNFVAIPQSMAIATLHLCMNNPDMFRKHIKITRGDACQLMTRSTTNLQYVCEIFREYARKIHQKADPRDPNFLAISIHCGKIEQFIESIFPTQDAKKVKAARAAGHGQDTSGSMAWEEICVLVAMIVGMFVIIGAIMIGTSVLMGANFTGFISDAQNGVKELFGNAAAGAKTTASAAHGEL